MSLAVFGAGAFGTALAIALSRNGPVHLWARDPEAAAAMRKQRENTRRLPGRALPDAVTVTADPRQAQARTILLAVPMQNLRAALLDVGDDLASQQIVACCKGMELGTGLGPVAVVQQVLPGTTVALLTGPSFADDMARGLPTALTLACTDPDVAAALQLELSTPSLRLYRTTDVIGAELGGALKNVMAIGCGAAMGAGLGESARAALMTRGFAEMRRFAAARGARPETLVGLSGFGDLVLTCASTQSRNFRLGLALGTGEPFDPAITVEGAATTRAVLDLAERTGLDLPVTAAVAGLLDGRLTVTDAIATLLRRPLREE